MSQDKKILVVEDNDFVRMQIVRYLEEQGYGVWGNRWCQGTKNAHPANLTDNTRHPNDADGRV